MEAEDSFTFGDVRYVAYISSCELLIPEILLAFYKLYNERGYLFILFFVFGGLQCSVQFFGHFFAYVCHFVVGRDVWICALRYQLSLPSPFLATPPYSLVSHPSPYLATATHPPT
jgi:hypothetical protein